LDTPALVAGLFVVVELATNALVEPLTYGKSAGVSTVALLVAATFWTWIWGPLGLLLSVPLTVALAVLESMCPSFELLGILLGDGPALDPHVSFYQRLLAGDADEAAAMIEEQLATRKRSGSMTTSSSPPSFWQNAIATSANWTRPIAISSGECRPLIEEHSPAGERASGRRVCVAGCASDGLADELALVMLQHIVAPECEMVITGPEVMASEKIAVIVRAAPQAVIVSAVGSTGDLHVRYLCKAHSPRFSADRADCRRWGYRGDSARMIASSRIAAPTTW